jgi:energy-coupling factor transporter transmembrane protein EcfT
MNPDGRMAAGLSGERANPVRNLDARVKVVLLLAASVAAFLGGALGLALLAAGTLGVLAASRTAPRDALHALAPALPLLALMVAANALRFDGTAAWCVAGPFGVDPAGLARGCVALARIALVMLLALVLTRTTDDMELTDALAALLGPLRRLRLPVDDLALLLSLAVRFVPLVAERLDRLRRAQNARGARVGQGGPVARVASWVPVLVPLVVGLFRHAETLAVSMEARGYTGAGRTNFAARALRPADCAVLAAGLLASLVAALL